MIDALYDSRQTGRPVVTIVFLAVCLVVGVASMFAPSVSASLGGIEPRRHEWQVLTAPFVHGWPGFPAPLHLALNAFLMLECGRPTERLLGSGRFLALCAAALAANAIAQSFTEGVNGSSLIIWAWGPSLYVALRVARPADGRTAAYARARGVLIVMYAAVPVAMATIPYALGWRGNPLYALAAGNLYHIVATGVGIGFALAWKRRIAARVGELPVETSK